MSTYQTFTPRGDLVTLMDELVALEEQVHPDLTVYRWRPFAAPQFPAIYNWMQFSPFEVMTTATWMDTINISARVAVPYSPEYTEDMELYVNAFRDVVDDRLWKSQPLGGRAYRARRTGMQTMDDVFEGAVHALAVSFIIECEMDRVIVAQ